MIYNLNVTAGDERSHFRSMQPASCTDWSEYHRVVEYMVVKIESPLHYDPRRMLFSWLSAMYPIAELELFLQTQEVLTYYGRNTLVITVRQCIPTSK